MGCDIDVDGGQATTAAVRSAGGEMTFVEADVADETAVSDLVDAAMRTYGGLDCAVNNAGTEATGLITDAADAVFDQLVATNLRGSAVLPQARDRRHANPERGIDRQHVVGDERHHRRPSERALRGDQKAGSWPCVTSALTTPAT